VRDYTYSQEKRNGYISKYLQRNIYRFINQRVTRNAIEYRIKLLVFEKLVGISGILAILSFGHYRFRAVKYGELVPLREMVDKSKWIKELVQRKAAWLDGCQIQYNGR